MLERVTGIEPALSAWEAVPSGPVTWSDLRGGVSASDRERPLVTGVNGPLMARRSPGMTCARTVETNLGGCSKPNRISSSGRHGSDPFRLDQRARSVLRVPRRTALNCNPNCNPQIRSNGRTVQNRPALVTCWANVPGLSSSVDSWLQLWQQRWQQSQHPLAIVVICSDRGSPRRGQAPVFLSARDRAGISPRFGFITSGTRPPH